MQTIKISVLYINKGKKFKKKKKKKKEKIKEISSIDGERESRKWNKRAGNLCVHEQCDISN